MIVENRLFGTSGGEIRGLVWGDPSRPAILGIHGGFGLAENFLDIGYNLSDNYCVVALDLPGRGKSFWAKDPATEYRLPRFVELIGEVLDQLKIGTVRWIGTSMGGATGIHAATGALKGRVSHLVLNDVGFTLPAHLTAGIRAALGSRHEYSTLSEVAGVLRAGLGELAGPARPESFWAAKAELYGRRVLSGGFVMHQDPRIEIQMDGSGRQDFETADIFQDISIPVMVIHGCKSVVLTDNIIDQMVAVKPDLVVERYRDWGHAPFLDENADAEMLSSFFQS